MQLQGEEGDNIFKRLISKIDRTQKFDKNGIGGRGNKIYFTKDKYREIVREAQLMLAKHVTVEIMKIGKIHPLVQNEDTNYDEFKKIHGEPVIEIQMTLQPNFAVENLEEIMNLFESRGLKIFNLFTPTVVENGQTFVAYTICAPLPVKPLDNILFSGPVTSGIQKIDSFTKYKQKVLRGGSDKRKSDLWTAINNDRNLTQAEKNKLYYLIYPYHAGDTYTPDHIDANKDVFGKCNRCGSPLVRDEKGRIICSNAACSAHYLNKQTGVKYDTTAMEYIASAKTGDNWVSKSARKASGSIARGLRDSIYDPNKMRRDGVHARENIHKREEEFEKVEKEAVTQFESGYTYKDAVKNLLAKHSDWWKNNPKTEQTQDRYIIYPQKNEIKAIIWDVYNHPGKHGISQQKIYASPTLKSAQDSVRGIAGAIGRMKIGVGNWSNRSNMGKVSNLQERLKVLDSERTSLENKLKGSADEISIKKYSALLEVKDYEIKETLKKIELIEEHPELVKRNARKLVGLGKGVKDGANKAVNGAVNGYSKHKAKIAGAISTICAFLILFLLLWMKVVGNSAYIPVSWAQIIVFMFFALLLEVIKSSMSEDKAGENEAREIIFILAVLALIITAAIKDPAVGFWTSLIFCAIISAYLLMDFYTDSALVSIVLAIVMMVVIYFTAAGWMDELGVQTEKLAVQTGFAEAIETSIGAVREGASDVWLMITNPNGWYAKKEMEQNAQKDPAASDRAVEITTAKITPSIVNLGDEINLLVEIENFGNRDTTKPARDVEISAKKTGNHQAHFALEDLQDEEDAEVIRYVGDIISGAGAQEVFEIKAPPVKDTDEPCIATFKLEAGVSYGYDVDTMGKIFIIGRKRYDELVKQDQFVQEKQVAKSSSGPVSVSIMTNLPQPIPVETGKEFSIHFGIVNTRSSNGEVNVTNVDIAIPKEFVPALDKGTYKNCKLCQLVDSDNNPIADDSFAHYSFKGLYCEPKDIKNGKCADDCLPTGPSKDLVVSGDTKIFKCEMKYDGTEDIPFKKPTDIHVSIDYIYKYTKTVSFTVRKRDIDLEEDITKCS